MFFSLTTEYHLVGMKPVTGSARSAFHDGLSLAIIYIAGMKTLACKITIYAKKKSLSSVVLVENG